MIELVRGDGQLVDIGADHIRRGVAAGCAERIGKTRQDQHKLLLLCALRREKLCLRDVSVILGENGLDADDRIQQIRAGVSLEGGEAIQIEHIILGREVGKVAVFERGQRDLTCRSRKLFVGDGLVGGDLLHDKVGDLADELLQTHHAAGAGLEGLAVLAVHRAEADVLKLRCGRNQLRLAGDAENLLKVQALALVRQIEDLVGVVVLLALHDGGKIGRGVERCAVRLDENAGRKLLGVAFLLHRHDQRAFGLDGQMLVLDDLQHLRNIRLRVAFTEPDVKRHVEVAVVFAEIGDGNADNVLPERVIAGNLLLELARGLMGTVRKFLVGLASRAGGGVDLLEVGDRKRRFGGIFADVALVKIGKLRLAFAQALDDKTHLKAPVAEVHVADDGIAEETVNAFDGLADDGAAEMADMERLCDVGSAIVEHNGARRTLGGHAEMRVLRHLCKIAGQIFLRNAQIQEAGLYGLRLRKQRVAVQLRGDLLRDLDGGLVIGLCGGHGAVALVFAQVGAIGERDLSIGGVVASLGKGIGDLTGDQVKQ